MRVQSARPSRNQPGAATGMMLAQRRRQHHGQPGETETVNWSSSATRPRGLCSNGWETGRSTPNQMTCCRLSGCTPYLSVLYQMLFSSERKRMTTVTRTTAGSGGIAGEGCAGNDSRPLCTYRPRRERGSSTMDRRRKRTRQSVAARMPPVRPCGPWLSPSPICPLDTPTDEASLANAKRYFGERA